MRETSSSEADEYCDSDLWQSSIRAEERYSCGEYETKTPEYIHDGIISGFEWKKEEENVWDKESEEDDYHRESV